MVVRNILRIDPEKCNGCGLCVNACVEGAIELVNGKATLVRDDYCDGLGACLPACPTGAVSIEEREAPAFDEEAARTHVERKKEVIAEAIGDGREQGRAGCPGALVQEFGGGCPMATLARGGCPGAALRDLAAGPAEAAGDGPDASRPSELRHWPVQLALVPPVAPFLKDADVVLTADCVPFAYADFHRDFLAGRAVLVACPKLDDLDAHAGKIEAILRHSGLRSLTILRMEVPCCGALSRAVERAVESSGSDVPVREVVIDIRGQLQP